MAINPNSSDPGRITDNAAADSSGQMWGTGPNPPLIGKPLPADDPWVINMAKLFNIPIPEAQLFAGKFRDNMFQWLNSQIKADMKRQHEAAQKFKESINQ